MYSAPELYQKPSPMSDARIARAGPEPTRRRVSRDIYAPSATPTPAARSAAVPVPTAASTSPVHAAAAHAARSASPPLLLASSSSSVPSSSGAVVEPAAALAAEEDEHQHNNGHNDDDDMDGVVVSVDAATDMPLADGGEQHHHQPSPALDRPASTTSTTTRVHRSTPHHHSQFTQSDMTAARIDRLEGVHADLQASLLAAYEKIERLQQELVDRSDVSEDRRIHLERDTEHLRAQLAESQSLVSAARAAGFSFSTAAAVIQPSTKPSAQAAAETAALRADLESTQAELQLVRQDLEEREYLLSAHAIFTGLTLTLDDDGAICAAQRNVWRKQPGGGNGTEPALVEFKLTPMVAPPADDDEHGQDDPMAVDGAADKRRDTVSKSRRETISARGGSGADAAGGDEFDHFLYQPLRLPDSVPAAVRAELVCHQSAVTGFYHQMITRWLPGAAAAGTTGAGPNHH
ncbi:hypothetical protein BC828DRAFT_277589 [Blastocladiella britannica]|nr:hypothetical protein BC828DRAFT_277589 [Blastocladiella britannica]